ncbi:hypothetical protein H6P81_011116 [Aristolochia fimbriata]|uniref:Uncharacterized protein n=1 Tax=Aristolochia fimbriata TaxID=158543 RepID=A0AAV7ETH7_ARIFI|nr:hypothetical protein H6P81_011116 [Aristolochia fimbriata]
MEAVVVDVVKVVGEWRVSPPLGSVPPTELRLSYFDVSMVSVQVEYLFFFDFPGSTQDFRDVHFPRLRNSLSLALSLFYPLGGQAVPSQESPYPGDHVIRYSDGDSVSLTLAESGADFASLVGNQAKEATAFHPLVPPLSHVITSVNSTEATKRQGTQLIAFRVTVFPGAGFSVGLTYNHVVPDGFGIVHFLKSWAAISKAGGEDVSVVKHPPVSDRAVLGDLEPLKRAFLVESAAKSRDSHASSDETLYFWLPANHRHRHRPPVRSPYFGNISPVSAVVEVSTSELTRENGAGHAARAIQAAIRRIDEGRVEQLPAVGRRWTEVMGSKPRERRFSVAGSPLFRVYDLDFGWGRLRKVEFPSMEETELASLSDSREEEGGVEVGVGGPEEEVIRFTSLFEEGLKSLCNVSKL